MSADSREVRQQGSEIKFLVTPDQAGLILGRAREWLAPDPFGHGEWSDEYVTTTLYFDTDRHDVFERRGSYGRAKYRIRRYGADDCVFLERKLRTAECLNKRRTIVSAFDLSRLQEPANGTWAGRWFQARLAARRLGGVCQVVYRRTARVGRSESGAVRLTVDQAIRTIGISDLAFHPEVHTVPVTAGVIVEMKFQGPMPAVFKRLAEEFALVPERVSKYRLAMAALRSAGLQAQASAPALVPHA